MNLFDSILKNVNPAASSTNQFLSGFQKPQEKRIVEQVQPGVKQFNKTPKQVVSFIPKVNAGEPLVSDDEIKQMIDAGASDDEIAIMVGELEKERGAKQEPMQTKSLGEKTSGFLESATEGAKNIAGGVIAQIPQAIGNLTGEAANLGAYTPSSVLGAAIKAPFSDKTYGEIRVEQKKAGEGFKKLGTKGKEAIQKTGLYNPESTGAKVGEFGTNILTTLVGPGKIFKTAEKANTAIKALAGAANASIQGTSAAITNYASTEGRLPTAPEVAQFIAIQGGFGVGGKIFEQVKKLPSARLIPTTITEAGRDIRKGIDIGDAISKTGISFTKGQLIKKVEKISQNLSNSVDSAIQRVIDKTGPNNVTISGLTKGLKLEIMNDSAIKAQLKGTPIQMPQIEETIDETITAYKNLYGAKKFDLNAQQQLKKDIYTGLENVFNKNFQTTGKITAQQATERQIARKLKENIETKVPEVAQLNKQLAPFLEAGKRLNAKGGYSGYLTDILAGGFASGNPQGIIQDPVGYAKNFLLGVVAKRAGTSTLAKTSASTISANIEKAFKNPAFQKAVLDQYRQLNSNQ